MKAEKAYRQGKREQKLSRDGQRSITGVEGCTCYNTHLYCQIEFVYGTDTSNEM